MGEFARKADGRRAFTAEFKRSTVERIRSGETTLATLAHEPTFFQLDLRLWKPFPLGNDRSGEAFLQVFNLLNRVNAGMVDGTAISRTFGEPIGLAGPPLTVEAGLRFQF